ncbi:type VII secretion protein EccB [Streptomyces sp. NPDC054765]
MSAPRSSGSILSRGARGPCHASLTASTRSVVPEASASACRPADGVAVQPGSGVLAAVATAGGKGRALSYLVTEDAVKYPIPSDDAAAQLGFGDAPRETMPAAVLDAVPTGPALDPSVLSSGGIVTPRAKGRDCPS